MHKEATEQSSHDVLMLVLPNRCSMSVVLTQYCSWFPSNLSLSFSNSGRLHLLIAHKGQAPSPEPTGQKPLCFRLWCRPHFNCAAAPCPLKTWRETKEWLASQHLFPNHVHVFPHELKPNWLVQISKFISELYWPEPASS